MIRGDFGIILCHFWDHADQVIWIDLIGSLKIIRGHSVALVEMIFRPNGGHFGVIFFKSAVRRSFMVTMDLRHQKLELN